MISSSSAQSITFNTESKVNDFREFEKRFLALLPKTREIGLLIINNDIFYSNDQFGAAFAEKDLGVADKQLRRQFVIPTYITRAILPRMIKKG